MTVQSDNGCTATATAEVTEDTTAPSVTATGGTVTCQTTSITLQASSAAPIVGWTGPNGFSTAQASPSVSVAGTYTVTVQSINGCTATATAVVSEDNATPSVTATGGTITCTAGSVALSASSASQVVGWTGPNGFSSTEASPSVSVAGTYTVTVQSANGCTATATAIVTSDDVAPSVTAQGGTITCTSSSVSLTASSAAAIVSWAGPNGFSSTEASPSVSVAGTYTVTVESANGCTATATATVTADDVAPSVTATGGSITCALGSVMLQASTSASVVSWTGPNGFSSTQAAPAVSTAGTYTVTVRSANGCEASATATVTADDVAPSVTAQGGTISCASGSVVLSANSAATLVGWTGPNGFNSTEATPSVSIAGTYTVTVQSANGCTATATATVTADDVAPSVTAQGGTITCAAGSVVLSANSAAAIVDWTGPNGFNSTEATPSVSVAGTYTVTVQSANGCTATATATVTADDAAPSVTAQGGTITCAVGSVTLSANSAATIVGWTGPNGFSSTAASPSVSAAGTYTVTVRSANGCEASATATVTLDNAGPSVTATGGTISCDGPQVVLSVTTNGTVVGWTGPNGFTSSAANPAVSTAGTYTVTVSSVNGCTATATAIVDGDSTAPGISATGGTITCDASSVTLRVTTSATSVSWTGPNGFSSSATNPVVSVAGVYTVTAQSANGCSASAEAVVSENLVNPADIVTNETICAGETFTWAVNGQQYTTNQTGIRVSGDGCTADQVLNLTVTPVTVGTITNETICQGESFFWEGQTFTTAGTFTASTGGVCAGVNTLILTVTQRPADIVTNETICAGETFTWAVNGQQFTTNQTGIRVSGDGCTADQVLNLTVTPKPADIVTTETLCPGESFTWSVNNVTYSEPQNGIRVAAQGCTADQVLNILPATDCIDLVPGISIVKRTNDRDIDVDEVPVILVGNTPMPVTWTYEVTNTGDVALTNVVVTDDREGQVCVIPTLAVGATQTCTLEGTASRGMYRNVATVTGSSDEGSVTASDESAYIGVFINVEKTVDRTEVCPGEEVHYTLTTRLLGGAPGIEIRNIKVDDSQLASQLNSNSPEFVASSDVNNDAMIAFIDNNNDGRSDEEFVWRYSLTVDQDSRNIAQDMGDVFFNGQFIGPVMAEDEVTVFVNTDLCPCDQITVVAQSTPSACGSNNGGAEVTSVTGGEAPYTYRWTDGQTTESISGLSAGTISVVVTDSNGCTGSARVTVEDLGGLVGVVFQDIIDAGCTDPNSGSATIMASGGAAPYTYSWSDGQTTQTATNLPEGTYSVRVTDANGCVGGAEVTIGQENCNASIGNFVWFDLDNDGIQDVDEPGAPDVRVELLAPNMDLLASTVTDADGMYSFINLPQGSYMIRFVLPSGSTFTSSNQGDDALDSDVVTPGGKTDLIVLSNGDDNLTIDAGLNGSSVCTLSLNITSTEVTCSNTGRSNDNGEATVQVTGGIAPYTYLWNTGATTPTITNLTSGLYTVEVTDAEGCTTSSESVVVLAQGCGTGDRIDLELIKRVNRETPQPGDTITFQLTVFNNSELNATGVTVEDVVPNGFAIVAGSIGQGGQLVGNNVVTWSGLNVDGLSLARLSFETVVLAPEEGRTYRNVAQITAADQNDVDSTPNNDDGDQSEDDEDFVIAMPQMTDVAISKSVSNANPEVGDVITYTITVTNEGTNNATHVEVTDYLPGEFCTNYSVISNNGIFLGDRIIWTDLNLASGESIDLSFQATVAARSLGEVVINLAEVTDMDQTDADSRPGNMTNGTPVEDDESSASFSVGGAIADLELLKDVDKVVVSPNDEVEFSITVVNHGPGIAKGIIIEDILPDGYANVRDVSHSGAKFSNRILWTIAELPVDSFVTVTFSADVVHFVDRECDYRNLAQIFESFTPDPDATPGNLDGEPSEDDEDYAEVEVQLEGGVCVDINTAVFIEGAFDYDALAMSNRLNRLGYLPGQKPSTFIGQYTEAGQPYSQAPWFHFGTEGDSFVQNGETIGLNGNYPMTAVDWVLVSLRSDVTAESTVGSVAALLHIDGTIEFVDGFGLCNIDPSEDYFIVVEHRNHLVAMSHVEIPVINGTMSYDFRFHNSYRRILGSGQKEVAPGIYAMIAGNGDQTTSAVDSRDINPNDLTKWLIDNGATSSYFLRDLDLSGDVNTGDKALLLINNGLFSDVPMRQ